MTTKVVRSSKYRHVFGSVAKKEDCYDELRITRSAWPSNFVTANPNYFAVIYESAGGGSFAVIPWAEKGKANPGRPLVNGHTAAVLDIEWNPFNDSIIASASEDCTAKIWQIPEGGVKATLTDPVQTLSGHRKKVGSLSHNPVANNILVTSATDFTVKVWDIEKGNAICDIESGHDDIIYNVEWTHNGSMLASSAKDKKIRIIDPRSSKITATTESHTGSQASKITWLTTERLITFGSSKTADREYAVWDTRSFAQPLNRTSIDNGSGMIMPFYDRDTGVLFAAGKGDGHIRYYEIVDEEPYIFFLTEFKSNTPQRGVGWLPKRGVDVSVCEIARAFKLGVKTMEPISFQVPRKSDVFQKDIFPDCFAGEPALTADQWASGKNAEPKTVSLEGGLAHQAKKQSTSNFQKASASSSDEVNKLKARIAALEAELKEKDARIRELESKQ